MEARTVAHYSAVHISARVWQVGRSITCAGNVQIIELLPTRYSREYQAIDAATKLDKHN